MELLRHAALVSLPHSTLTKIPANADIHRKVDKWAQAVTFSWIKIDW